MSERRVSPLTLERFLCDEASPEERALVERAYGPDELARLRSADQSLRARLQRSPVRTRLLAQQAGRGRRRATAVGGALLAAAAAFALTALPTSEPRDRAKGLAPELRIYRSTPRGPERVPSGAAARSHDVVQLAMVGVGRRCAAVLSLDGNGALTWHYRGAAGDGPSGVGGEQRLPHAYELDDAPGFERFWLVLGPCPLALDAIEADAQALARDPAARALAPLRLSAGLTAVEARLAKEAE